MADVPFATNLLGVIPPLIAEAPGAVLPGQAIGNLPDAYWAGQNQAYLQRNRNLFQDRVPSNIQDLATMLLRARGAEGVPEFVSLANVQGAADVLARNREIDQGGNATGYVPPAPGPQAQIPPTPEAGGTATLRQIAEARGVPVEQLMRNAGVGNPDQPLDFDQRKAVVASITAPAQPAQVAQAGDTTPTTFANRFPGITTATGGASGITAPTGRLPPSIGSPGPPAPPQAQSPPMAQAQPQAAPMASGPGLRPPAMPAQLQAMEQRAQQLESLARQKAGLGIAAGRYGNAGEQKSLEAEAERLGKAAQSVRDSMQRMMEPTEAEKNVNNPAVAAGKRAEELQKIRDTEAEAKNSGIQAQAAQYRDDLKPYTDLGMSILSDPRVYTGIGANAVLDINKVKAYFGDGRAAMMQEAVQKLQAASVLAQINTQRAQMQSAGEKSSRMFSSQIEQVEKASANMGNTIYGNRFLLNVQQHMGETAMEVARQAREYRAKYGTLDDGFDTQIEKYLEKHPVFSDLERARPDILGAPQVPPGAKDWSKEQAAAWGREHGLKAGEVARVGVGKYLTIPRIDVYRKE